jgi:hypothetical protein
MENLTKQLSHIIDVGTKKNPLPMKQGNSIRIGIVAIRYSANKGYLLFDCEQSKQVCLALSKPGALAIAKLYNAKQDYRNAVVHDKEYDKHDTDCIFYEHLITSTTDNFKFDLAHIRLEISEARRNNSYRILEAIIFD